MKNLIVCIGVSLLFMVLLQYQSDVNMFIRNAKTVQVIVEDAALSASLFYDKESFHKGEFVFTRKAADAAFNLIEAEINKQYWKGVYGVKVSCYSEDKNDEKQVYYYQRLKGLQGRQILQCKPHEPGVEVEIFNLRPNFKFKPLKDGELRISKKALYVYSGYDPNLESK